MFGMTPFTLRLLGPRSVILLPSTTSRSPSTLSLATPTTTPIEAGRHLSISKIVELNYAFACFLGAGCPTTEFNYTIFIENYGTSKKQRLHNIGDCLPPGFAFLEVTAVNYIHKKGGGDPLLTVAELDSHQVLPPYYFYDGPLCPAGREMVVWVFEKPKPNILLGDTAEIHFTVTAQVGEPDTHYNLAWVNADDDDQIPEDLEDMISTGLTSPLVFILPSYDISSSAGGATVETRVAVNEDTDEYHILSWQVE